MRIDELKEKAAALPQVPGVYIMRDKSNQVIYVGKAKKLKNRVSQYFVDTVSHSPKTRLMVGKIHDFDVIVSPSEFEALVLECSLIKQHMPKYNILLKDDKGYPFVRLDANSAFPTITLVNKRADDGAIYFGPYGSRGITQDLIDAVKLTLKLPSCNKKFPRDMGKGRPCLNYHMNQCEGWCQKEQLAEAYQQRIAQAKQLLQGDFKQVSAQIKKQMLDASEKLNFELAASLRDQLKAVEALGQKQLVTGAGNSDTDVIGFYQTESKACFTVLHFCGGSLMDKEYEILLPADDRESAVSSLVTQFYLNRGYAPKFIFLPFALADSELIEDLFRQRLTTNTKIKVPARGDNVRLVEMARMNAVEEVERITSREERTDNVLSLLGKMLKIPAPNRIESFDISNISGTDIVGSMVVFMNGRPKKSDYKRFSIRDIAEQDDYASMHQVVLRRFTHLKNADAGFDQAPDLLLIDGGVAHAQVALQALNILQIQIPVFGMVKDDRHRTRGLVTPDGMEIAIDTQQSVFAFIGSIQEETHRFAITYHRQLRSKRLQYSELDRIPGVGPKRKTALLKTFQSISSIKQASVEELLRVLPADAANSVYRYFHNTNGE